MGQQIIGLHQWFETPPGQYLLGWQRARVDAAVSDLFGYHALQLGLPELDALKTNRMPHQWLGDQPGAPQGLRAPDFLTDFDALPFPAAIAWTWWCCRTRWSCSVDPHATLREVERVLVPEGRVVICRAEPGQPVGPCASGARTCTGAWAWARLCSCRPKGSSSATGACATGCACWVSRSSRADFGCWRPAVMACQAWLRAALSGWTGLGARWWPIFGAVYFVVAVKRVRGMRLLGARVEAAPARANAPVSIANRHPVPSRVRRRVQPEANLRRRDLPRAGQCHEPELKSTPTGPARAIPGRAAGARLLKSAAATEKELFGGEAGHHQQPDGTDGGDRGAGLRCEASVRA
jgi:hypothetical protein